VSTITTEADLALAPSLPPADRAESPVLAVIDMQRVFGDPVSPWKSPRFEEIVGPVRELTEAFSPRAVFTRFIAPAEPWGAWRAYYDEWPFALQPPGSDAWRIVRSLADAAARVGGADGRGGTIDCMTFSKWGPGLAALVGREGRLMLAGVSTDCCVLSTALAAADSGAEVLVVGEACAGVDDESHAKALHVMGLYGPLIRVISLDEALAMAPGPAE
jgi:nicotinamidase-related amidase